MGNVKFCLIRMASYLGIYFLLPLLNFLFFLLNFLLSYVFSRQFTSFFGEVDTQCIYGQPESRYQKRPPLVLGA